MAKKKQGTVHEYKAAQMYDVEQREGESEIEYYTRLAKAADQRLVRLEKLAGEEGFASVKQYAYAQAMRNIESYGKSGDKLRFNTKPPEDRRLFREKIMDMRAFLSSPTSTKKGIIETYQKRVDTINSKYGTNYTWQQLANFFDSGDAGRLFKEYGSKTVMRAIGKIQKTKEELDKDIGQNGNVRKDEDEVATNVAYKIMTRPALQSTDIVLNMTQKQRAEVKKRLKGKGK